MTCKPTKLVSKSGNYWLLKSEPETFSIDDLRRCPKQTTCWDGVRNYQARNFLRDAISQGDLALFYHSNASPPAVMGVVKIVRGGYPDPSAWDPEHSYYDPKSRRDQPTWFAVDVQWVCSFASPLELPQLREIPQLSEMVLLQRGSRLSVQPVRASEFQAILRAAR